MTMHGAGQGPVVSGPVTKRPKKWAAQDAGVATGPFLFLHTRISYATRGDLKA